MNIPEEYQNWTYDHQAEARFTPKKIVKVAQALSIGFFVILMIAGVFGHRYYSMPRPLLLTLVGLAFGSAIVLHIFKAKSKTTAVNCTRCGNPMKYVEVNHPPGSFTGYLETFAGDSGRVYVRSGSGGPHGGHPSWNRLMQGIHECSKCHRFIVSSKSVCKPVGGTRAEAEQAERNSQIADQVRKELNGKRIVKK